MSAPVTTEESLRQELRALYRSCGYLPFKVNKFEEYDLYAQNKSFLSCQRVLTFSDTDGRLMALKPDVTMSIVRSAAGREPLRKVYYTENVYRVSDDGDGFREIPQTGLECIGELDLYAVAEAVMLAARSLELIGEKHVLDISHMGVVSGLLSAAGVPEDGRGPVMDALAARNLRELSASCAGLGVGGETAGLLRALSELSGGLAGALAALRALPLPPECRAAAEELSALSDILGLYGLENLRLDFSVVSDPEYYSGVVFRGFVEGAASGVLSGGRYDRLLTRMGKAGGAVGFAVYLDRLERLAAAPRGWDADTLILYGGDGDLPAVIDLSEKLRAQGRSVRAQRSAPAGLSFRQTVRINNGEVCPDE